MSALDMFWAAPPVSRTITALTLATSVLVYSGLLPGYYVVFLRELVFKFPVPEIWRLLTAFCVTGPQLSIMFDTFFLWNYSRALEVESSRFAQPGDYFTYVVFLSIFIVASSGLLLGGKVFTQALILGIAYTYAQDNKNKKVSFFVITIKAVFLPWTILGLTLVLGGPDAALQQVTGLIAAHLYDFLTRLWPTFGGGQNYIQTPALVKRWFGAEDRTTNIRAYGTAFRPGTQPQAPSTGSSTGFNFGSAWGGRGQGRRLGGE